MITVAFAGYYFTTSQNRFSQDSELTKSLEQKSTSETIRKEETATARIANASENQNDIDAQTLLRELKELEQQRLDAEERFLAAELNQMRRRLDELQEADPTTDLQTLDEQLSWAIMSANRYGQTLGVTDQQNDESLNLIVTHFPDSTLAIQLREIGLLPE